jgi:DsbC/DsbD-like thiol-disulfide interchange protein
MIRREEPMEILNSECGARSECSASRIPHPAFSSTALLAALVFLGTSVVQAAGEEAQRPITERLKGFATMEDPQVTAELIAEHASVQPGGGTRIGVHFEMEDGWHIYAHDPGDAGLPTKVLWSAPKGVTVGPLQWPKAHEFLDPGEIRTFGYAGTVVLHSTLALTHNAQTNGAIPIQAQAEWLACKEICVPGAAYLELTLPITPHPQAFSTHAQLFEQVEE